MNSICCMLFQDAKLAHTNKNYKVGDFLMMRTPGFLGFGPTTFLKAAMFFGLLSLNGCAFIEGKPTKTVRDDATFVVTLVDSIDYRPGMDAYGLTKCVGSVCEITLLKSQYPYCLTHEIRHVFEGAWHAGYETTEDCLN